MLRCLSCRGRSWPNPVVIALSSVRHATLSRRVVNMAQVLSVHNVRRTEREAQINDREASARSKGGKPCALAVITGGMGGLGESISTKMHAAGYRVVVTYSPGNKRVKDWLARQKASGREFTAYPVDVTDFDSCKNESFEEKFLDSVKQASQKASECVQEQWKVILDKVPRGGTETGAQVRDTLRMQALESLTQRALRAKPASRWCIH
jgi:hypothetical protein